MAVVENLQQIASLFSRCIGKSPVVENEEFDPSDGLEQPGVAAIAACEGERIEQARDAMIEHRAIVATGLVAERTGDPAFAEAGRPRDIRPKNMCLRLSSTIRIILAVDSTFLRIGVSFTAVVFTLRSSSRTAVVFCCRRG